MRRSKTVLYGMVLVLICTFALTPLWAEAASSTGVMVNNRLVPGNGATVNLNGTVLIPAKELINALGGSFNYDSSTLTGTVRQGENELVFRLDDSIVKLNGKYIQAPAAMKIINNRFMVPAEFTAKQLGAETYMNSYKNVMMIFLPADGKLVYQVMSGDTLWIISNIFGVSITAIRQQNNLSGDMLYIGQKLSIKNFSSVGAVFAAQITQNATIMSGAGWNSSVAGYLKTGTSISVAGKNGSWFKVITPKGNGYAYYTVVGVKQDIQDNASNSTYFNSQISIDTSMDTISYTNYTVRSGDSIWSISANAGIPDYELAQANSISSSSVLQVGQIIKIPVHNIPIKPTAGSQYGEILDWFKEAQYVFPIGKTGKLTDMETGKSFMIKRTIGANHSDTETLTAGDTNTMKSIFGGSWTWSQRAFILEVDGRRISVSVSGMPHAGVDGAAFLQNVNNRSCDWGSGPNYDSISGNGMDGHFDMYFLNCLSHNTSSIDPLHQFKVLTAGGLQ